MTAARRWSRARGRRAAAASRTRRARRGRTRRSCGSPSSCEPRVSAWIAVPCASPLIHGGVPPPNAKKYSHAVKPPRCEASATMRSSSARSSSGRHGGGGSTPGWRRRVPAAGTRATARWPCRSSRAAGSAGPGPDTTGRRPGRPRTSRARRRARRRRCTACAPAGAPSGTSAWARTRRCAGAGRKAAGIRVDVSSLRRASDSTPATTARSSPLRPLRIRLAVARARR